LLLAEEGGRLTLSNAILGRIEIPLVEVERRSTNALAATKTAQEASNVVTTIAAQSSATHQRLAELQAVYLANQISPQEYHRRRAKLLAELRSTDRPHSPPPSNLANGVPAPALVNPAVVATPPPGPSSPTKPAVPKHWSGEALLGADLGFSEKNRQLYTGRLKFLYSQKSFRNAFDYLATYGRTDGDLSANRMDGSTKSDYDLNRRMYVYTLGGAGYDEIRKIEYRYEVGPGAGKHLLRLTNLVLNAEAGVNYQVQDYEGNRKDDLFHFRLAQDLKWNMGTQFTFDEKVEYLPQWNNPEEYKLRVEGNIRYWVRANLSLNVTVINIFDTLTARGVQRNDLQVRSSVGVKF
jgi:hypothetical protein